MIFANGCCAPPSLDSSCENVGGGKNGMHDSSNRATEDVPFPRGKVLNIGWSHNVLKPSLDGSWKQDSTRAKDVGQRGGKTESNNMESISGWVPIQRTGPLPIQQLGDKRVLEELSGRMMSQLNSMLAFMQHLLKREQVQQSSNTSMMLRSVDKDLRDIYKIVKDIFGGLTAQLGDLVAEVDRSRKKIMSIEEKHSIAKNASEERAQYVVELETVLDGQCQGISETLRKLNEKIVGNRQCMATMEEEARRRESKLRSENQCLRQLVERLNEEQRLASGDGLPPLLPEMASTWTRRSMKSKHGAEDDVVGLLLSHCDSRRAVSRGKEICSRSSCRWPKTGRHRCGPSTSGSCAETDAYVTELRRRVEKAEERCRRLYGLAIAASRPLALLRDVLCELRSSHLLGATQSCCSGSDAGVHKPIEIDAKNVLQRLAARLHAHAPSLTRLPEVLSQLAQESAEAPPMDA